MEEPHFVKCEPGWLSDTEKSYHLDKYVHLPTDHSMIKTEPDDASAEPSVEEANAEIVKRELEIDIEDFSESYNNGEWDVAGCALQEMQFSSFSSSLDNKVTSPAEAETEEVNEASHGMTWLCHMCGRVYRTESLLNKHMSGDNMESHPSTFPYTCGNNDLRMSKCAMSSSTETASETDIPVMSPPKKRPKTRPLSLSEKRTILNLYKMLLELYPDIIKDDVIKKTALCTGISATSVYRVIKEYRDTNTLMSPKKRRHRTKVLDTVSILVKNAVRCKVHEFFFHKEFPRFRKVLANVNKDPALPDFRRNLFYNLLREINFKYLRRGCDRVLVDKDDIVLWRRNYVHTVRLLREEGRPVYYLGDLQLNINFTEDTESLNDARKLSMKGKDKVLIITHVGSKSGFLDGCLWLFESTSSENNHNQIYAESFGKWFLKVLSQLEENAVIVLSKMPHHLCTKEGNRTESANELQGERVRSKNEPFQNNTSQERMEFKTHNLDCKSYISNEATGNLGRTVLRIPPYHSELNPIELVWAQIRDSIQGDSTTYKMDEFKELVEELVRRVGANEWSKCVHHVTEKIENEMRKLDTIIKDMVKNFGVNLNYDSDSSLESS